MLSILVELTRINEKLKMDRSLPKIVKLDDETNNKLLQCQRGERTGFYLVGEEQYLLPSKYADDISFIDNFECREDDVWIVTFPRSGTTLSQELIWMVMNNFDYEKAKKINLSDRAPFFEMNLFVHDETKQMFLDENCDNPDYQKIVHKLATPGYEILKDMDSPRLIKTHLPISILPKGVKEMSLKIIYIARNPKDVLPSYYLLLKLWRTTDYIGTFREFWEQFRDGLVSWAPFWPHIIEGWKCRNDDNVLFMFYEDMMKDMHEAIFKVADFLSIPVTEEQVAGLAEHLDIKNFSKNKSVNCDILKDAGILNKDGASFVRQGKKREKPKEMTPEIIEEVEKWIEENYKYTDLRFPSY